MIEEQNGALLSKLFMVKFMKEGIKVSKSPTERIQGSIVGAGSVWKTENQMDSLHICFAEGFQVVLSSISRTRYVYIKIEDRHAM